MQSWQKVEVFVKSQGIEYVCGVFYSCNISGGLEIDDPQDLKTVLNDTHWDFVGEQVIKSLPTKGRVCGYLPLSPAGRETLSHIQKGLSALQKDEPDLDLKTVVSIVNEADWADSWKQYFKPIEISKKLVIKPEWESYQAPYGCTVVNIDPGMAFGTGQHETTALCLKFLEEQNPQGKKVLDLGCGSGILFVSAMKLGAGFAVGVDIDDNAVRVAKENALRNNLDPSLYHVYCGNALTDEALTDQIGGGYDLCSMNIVADVIKALLPVVQKALKKGGYLITSGIITERSADVTEALLKAHFSIIKQETQGSWQAICCRYEG